MSISKFKKPPVLITDQESYEMGIHDALAEHIARRLSCGSLLELCTGAGLTTIQLARFSEKVTSIEIDSKYLDQAKHNVKVCNLQDKVDLVLGNALDDKILKGLTAEAIFIDPDYSPQEHKSKQGSVGEISKTTPALDVLYQKAKKITPNIAIRVSRFIKPSQLRQLGPCELEYIYLNDQLQFLVAYFGELKRRTGNTAFHMCL